LPPDELQKASERIGEIMKLVDEYTGEWMELEDFINKAK
jgi:hypothetical protein